MKSWISQIIRFRRGHLSIQAGGWAKCRFGWNCALAAGLGLLLSREGALGASAPVITTRPATQQVELGGTVNLSVAATGTAPLGFQWFKNGGMVVGATGSTLAVSNAGMENSGLYYVVVTNADGLSISLPAAVEVGTPELLAWGNNTFGQLGYGGTTEPYSPESVAGSVVAGAAGSQHSVYVKSDGTLWTMGYNFYGQLGDGTTSNRSSAVCIASNVVAVAAGADHSLFLKTDGTMWGMGYNWDGELGDGTPTQRNSPEPLATNVVALAPGQWHSLFLKSDGTLWATGQNYYGQLGDGTLNSRNVPELVSSNVVAAAAGALHSLFMKTDGTLWGMGNNADGELGDGTTTQRTRPEVLASNVVAVAAGEWHSLFLKSDGTLWATGQNDSGQLGDGTTIGRTAPELVATNVLAVTAGDEHSVFLKRDGTLWGMGDNDDGEVGDGTSAERNSPVRVRGKALAGVFSGCVSYHTLAVGIAPPPLITGQPASQAVSGLETATLAVTATGKTPMSYQWLKDGRVIAGATGSALSLPGAGATNSGVYYVVITNEDGLSISQPARVAAGSALLLAWGNNDDGQLGDGTTINALWPEVVDTNVVIAAAGGSHSLYLKGDGTLWGMGNNADGELGDGTTTQRTRPETVASNVVAVAAGQSHSLFLRSDGTLWTMGYNADGQLGNGSSGNRLVPQSVVTNVVAVAAGANHSLFLKNDGTLWAMGYNNDGELGDGTTTDRYSPVPVLGGINVVAVAAGAGHSLFVKSDGTLWSIGYNQDGELGDGTTINRSIPVSVLGGSNAVSAAGGANHSLFLKSDGTLWGMGYNFYGELGDGTITDRTTPESVTSNGAAVAAGWYSSVFAKCDGTLWAMGYNDDGQLGDGTTTQQDSPVRLGGISAATVTSCSHGYHALAVGLTLPPEITSPPTNQTVAPGGTVTFSVTASGFGPLRFQWQLDGTNLVNATNATYTLASATTQDAGNYAVAVNSTAGNTLSGAARLTISKGTPTVTTWPTATAITYGQTLASSTLTGGAVSVAGSFAFTTPGTAPAAGTASQSVTFTPTNTTDYTTVIGSVSVTVNLATATVTLGNLSQTYDGTAKAATATTSPTNLLVTLTYNGLAAAPTNAGTYAVVGTVTDANYQGSATSLLVINQSTATVTAWPTATAITNGQTLASSTLIGGAASVDGGFAFTSPGTTPAAGTSSQPVVFTPADATDYMAVTGSVSVAVVATVTVSANPASAGTVTGGGVCVVGTNAVLTATATNGWQFISWNDGTTNNPYVITVPATNCTYTANFAAVATITLAANPSAGGSVTGGGTFLVGTTNVITALASNNWAFVGWSNGTTNNPYSITVPATNCTFTANFAALATITVQASPSTGGWVSGGGTFLVGTTNVITALASNKWVFVAWNDGSTNNPYAVVAVSNQTYRAYFQSAATITGIASPPEGGWTTGGGVYAIGNSATLKGTATNGWLFLNWNGTVTNYMQTGNRSNPWTFRVAANTNCTANFAPVTNGFVYTVMDTKPPQVEIIGYVGPTNGTVVIPSVIAGMPVTVIATGAFLYNSITNLVVPGSITNIQGGSIAVVCVELLGATAALIVEADAFEDVAELDLVDVSADVALDLMEDLEDDDDLSSLKPVNVSPEPADGGNCGGNGFYKTGASVLISAKATSGWRFTGWDDGNELTERTITVSEEGNDYTAQFAKNPTVTTEATPEDGGSVTGGGTFKPGETVTLTAITNSGFRFKSWDDGTLVNPYVFQMPEQDVTRTATFVEQVEVEAEADPTNGGYVLGAGTFDANSPVVLTALPYLGWRFNGWFLDGLITNVPVLITVASPSLEGIITYTAKFVQTVEVTALAYPTNAGNMTGTGTYDVGDTNVILTATASNNWQFIRWSNGATNNPYVITAPQTDITLTANFEPTATVTVTANPTNGGAVNGGGTFLAGSANVLTALASNGWAFVGWSDGTTNNPYAMTVPATNCNYTANFGALATITVGANPSAGGSVTGGGTFLVGTTNVITALASNNWAFVGWSDGTTNNPYPITVPATNCSLTANFGALATITVEANPSAGGSVTGGGTYLVGTTNVITALASNNWIFVGWSDGTTTNAHSVVVTSNQTYTALFKSAATVTTIASPPEGGWTAGGGLYAISNSATVTATATNGWLFLNWNGTATNYTQTGNQSNPWTFPVGSNITCTANFAQVTNGFVYALMDTQPPQVEIIGYVGPTNGTIVIPSMIADMPVTVIATGAFWWNPNPKIVVPGSVTNIQSGSIAAARVELLGATSALVVATDAFKNAGEVVLVDVAASDVADLMSALADDDDLSTLAPVCVSPNPTQGGACEGSGFYTPAASVLIRASASTGWEFTGWSDGQQSAERAIIVSPNGTNYSALFARKLTVTTEVTPEEGGSVTGGGTFESGATVTLTAITNGGYRFLCWDDGTVQNPYVFQMAGQDITRIAIFMEQVEVEAEADPTNGGFVVGAGIYDAGSQVTLTATPNRGWRFNGWFLAGLITNAPVLITVASPSLENLGAYTAQFVQTVRITALAYPTNAGSVTGTGTYDIEQTNVVLTATPANNWRFVRWNNGNTNNPRVITAPAKDRTCTAFFTTANPTNIATSVSGKTLTLTWPDHHLGWILQAQTNGLSAGSTNWFDVTGTGNACQVAIPIDPADPPVFYRLRRP